MENKNLLKDKIVEFIDTVIEKAEQDDKLDHFSLEISNHQGNLQMNYSLRDRKKIY